MEDVKKVVEVLKGVNFQVNLKKSEFFCPELNFLGMKLQRG